MSEELVYDPNRHIGYVDRILLRGASAGKSPIELSELTNGTVSPAKAAQQVRDILASRDWLTDMERKQLLVDDLMALKDVLMEKAVSYKMLDAAGPLTKVLRTIGDILLADKINLKDVLESIRKAQAQMMLVGIRAALERTFLELERRYPEMPALSQELNEIFVVALPEAIREIEAKVKEE